MFEWAYLTSAMHELSKNVYKCDGVEIARIGQKVDRTWIAHLNQHLPYEQRKMRVCTDEQTGRRGIELWAFRHSDRLHREVKAIEAGRPYRAWMPAGQKDKPR